MNKTEYKNNILNVMYATPQQMEEGIPVLNVEDKEKFLENQLGIDDTFKKSVGTKKELEADGSIDQMEDEEIENEQEETVEKEDHDDDDDEEQQYDPQAIYGEDNYAPYENFNDDQEDEEVEEEVVEEAVEE
eukprot:CAMPEP_0117424656 /NCGR_PEP_ID=MMETSP0758-20121206/5034_1 /TAXON_ID=63605 /ORGANISM="Percolomonas cosmopolitus, Strain AE-1 (ATCC 50343)" /LENGTH=131 /DNA_ID=CAMNT_0005208571 /DNA_START=259 /DNA_END=651 /DNA_ORIENTATION=+